MTIIFWSYDYLNIDDIEIMVIDLCPIYRTLGLKATWKVSNIMDARIYIYNHVLRGPSQLIHDAINPLVSSWVRLSLLVIIVTVWRVSSRPATLHTTF